MKKRAKRWAGALALTAGAISAAFLFRRRKAMGGNRASEQGVRDTSADKWARPGMSVIFRAELMPGRSRAERTFKVVKVLPSNRVTLEGFAGEHTETEFEAAR